MCNDGRGIRYAAPPEFDAVTWLAGVDDGPLQLSAVDEPLIYLYFFQSWCPGCHAHGFPTMAQVKQHVEDLGRPDLVRFIAVQTVFEGHETNTAQAALESVAKHGLTGIAVGHDAGCPPTTMENYHTGGTPWTVLIGPGSPRQVLADGFRIDADPVIALIDQLAAADKGAPT